MKALVLTISIMSLFLGGCASEFTTDEASNNPEAPFVEIPTDGSSFVPDSVGAGLGAGFNGNYQYGHTVSLNLTSMQTLSEYTGRAMGSVTNPRININFVRIGDGYGGTVTVAYEENSQIKEGFFTTGYTEEEIHFNVWHDENGNPYFHAILEDFYGGLVIVIDDFIDFGDGQGPQAASGSVWFKNFETNADLFPGTWLAGMPCGTPGGIGCHPPTRCWFVEGYYDGQNIQTPYDCRPWPVSSANPFERNNTFAQAEPMPSSGYLKLGTFTNVDINQAFGGDVSLTDIFN